MRHATFMLALSLAGSRGSAQTPPSPGDSAYHALSRLAYGVAPGLADSLARDGVLHWIDRQLDAKPGSDPALREWDPRFTLLRYSPDELARRFAEARRERAQARRDRGGAEDSTMMPGGERRGPAAPGLRDLRELGAQLPQLAVVRGIAARDQLVEVLADFWINHFNVFYGKGLDRVYLPSYVEETIRPRVLGKFVDLLIATARSPAMLFYLDNAQSVAPGSEPPAARRFRGGRARRFPGRFPGRPGADSMGRMLERRRPTGINENYARELLELHTLGVDGGYTQMDVVNVARIFTGWSIRRPAQGGEFVFNDWAHDHGRKVVLGEEFPAGHGEDEGIRLLKVLANHPATMHHVSAKLCARFVTDDPPDGCVDDAVAAWKRSGGEIRQVLRAIFHSPDFWAPRAAGAKVKTPLEFVLSAVRAVGGVPDTTPRLAQAIARLGEPLFLQPVPTGYPETQEDWVNSGALLNRMNFAVALAAGRQPGVSVDLDRLLPETTDGEALIESVNRLILGGRMSENTRAVLRRELGSLEPAQARAMAVGLALGGPEFQRQ